MGLRIFTTYEEVSATLSRLHRLIGEAEEAIEIVTENHNSALYIQGSERAERVRYFPGDLDATIEEIQESVNALKLLSSGAREYRRQQREIEGAKKVSEENSVDE